MKLVSNAINLRTVETLQRSCESENKMKTRRKNIVTKSLSWKIIIKKGTNIKKLNIHVANFWSRNFETFPESSAYDKISHIQPCEYKQNIIIHMHFNLNMAQLSFVKLRSRIITFNKSHNVNIYNTRLFRAFWITGTKYHELGIKFIIKIRVRK